MEVEIRVVEEDLEEVVEIREEGEEMEVEVEVEAVVVADDSDQADNIKVYFGNACTHL